MADTPIDDRRFTDTEVREILKRAVQHAPSRSLSKREGLSLAELRAIAGEAGIDPRRIEEAARDVALRRGAPENPLIGAPLQLQFERTVEGVIAPEDAPRVLSLIRDTTGLQGEVADIRGSLEWSARGDFVERHVSVWSRDGSTTIRAASNLNNAALIAFLPAGILSLFVSMAGVFASVKTDSVIPVLIVLAVLSIVFGGLRAILRRLSKSEAEKLENVVSELTRLAETATDTSD